MIHLIYCMGRKAICKCLSADVHCVWALLRLDFHISPYSLTSAPLHAPTSQTRGKWQLSLICTSPKPPSRPWNEFISTQWDANIWCYNNITSCHNQLFILKRDERCHFCHFLCIVYSLKGQCLLTQIHEKIWLHKHIVLSCSSLNLQRFSFFYQRCCVMSTLQLFHLFSFF